MSLTPLDTLELGMRWGQQGPRPNGTHWVPTRTKLEGAHPWNLGFGDASGGPDRMGPIGSRQSVTDLPALVRFNLTSAKVVRAFACPSVFLCGRVCVAMPAVDVFDWFYMTLVAEIVALCLFWFACIFEFPTSAFGF